MQDYILFFLKQIQQLREKVLEISADDNLEIDALLEVAVNFLWCNNIQSFLKICIYLSRHF